LDQDWTHPFKVFKRLPRVVLCLPIFPFHPIPSCVAHVTPIAIKKPDANSGRGGGQG
jgi:hypothetical protein